MTDAFAAAAQQTAAPASAPDSGESAAVKAETDFGGIDNPFLTSSDVNTAGPLGPRCSLEDAIGRLVVMIPQGFTEKTLKKEDFRKSADDLYQPTADIDLFVFGNEPFGFTYPVRDGDKVEYKSHVSETIPYVEKNKRLFSAGLAWSIKRAMDQKGILFGVLSYGPTNRKAGGDIDTVTAAINAWKAAGSRGEKPRSTYVLDDRPHTFTPALRAEAGAWWNEYRKTL
jgi:hypothetical protein